MQSRANWVFLTIGLAAVLLIGGMGAANITAVSAEKSKDIMSRLQLLEDREEIRQLLKDYGAYLDRRDFASFSQLFAEKEGEWIGGFGKAKSAQGIRKFMEDNLGKAPEKPSPSPPPASAHLFSNEIIKVDGDHASATTKWMFWVQGDAKRPQPIYLGHYEDTLLREGGRWKFLRRVVYSDIPPDNPLASK